jgi:hypothetical protein
MLSASLANLSLQKRFPKFAEQVEQAIRQPYRILGHPTALVVEFAETIPQVSFVTSESLNRFSDENDEFILLRYAMATEDERGGGTRRRNERGATPTYRSYFAFRRRSVEC